MPYPVFDRSRLRIQPLARRRHDLDLSVLLGLDDPLPDFSHPALSVLGRRLVEARREGRARILLMGAHVLRAGVARHLIDLMERGLIDHLAMNGPAPSTIGNSPWSAPVRKASPTTSRPASSGCGRKPGG